MEDWSKQSYTCDASRELRRARGHKFGGVMSEIVLTASGLDRYIFWKGFNLVF